MLSLSGGCNNSSDHVMYICVQLTRKQRLTNHKQGLLRLHKGCMACTLAHTSKISQAIRSGWRFPSVEAELVTMTLAS